MANDVKRTPRPRTRPPTTADSRDDRRRQKSVTSGESINDTLSDVAERQPGNEIGRDQEERSLLHSGRVDASLSGGRGFIFY